MQLAQVRILHAKQLGHRATGELAQMAPGVGQKQLPPVGLQPLGQARSMVADQKVDAFKTCHLLALCLIPFVAASGVLF